MIEKAKEIFNLLILISLFLLISLFCLFAWKGLFWKPLDDYFSFVEDINCTGDACTIRFKYNTTGYSTVAGTGSDVPVVGGKDYVICLDAKEVVAGDDLREGMLVNTAYLHFIEKIKDGLIITRGSNTIGSDPYKFPINSLECVVAAVMR